VIVGNFLGFDIGGANTKACFVKTRKGKVVDLRVVVEYFPIWKMGKNQLPILLRNLKNRLANSDSLDAVGVTMTAELSDVYYVKREGVNHILDCVKQIFRGLPTFVLDTDGKLKTVEEARKEPLKTAAANWAATGWLVSRKIKNCIIIDVGSTTTTLIPIINGNIVVEGKTDLEKLIAGELVYTGALRTNVATIVNSVPIRRANARISSELFALSGDVYLILGNINARDYTTETADGRGKTREEALARLARVVCADVEILSEAEIVRIARYVSEEQVKQIAGALKQICSRREVSRRKNNIVAVVTGVGRRFLGEKAARKAGFKRVKDISSLFKFDVASASPCVGVGLMVGEFAEGRTIRW
jgi:probable H4MPT-linked C1 transfer pathway protein